MPLLGALVPRAAGYGACVAGFAFFAVWPLACRERPPVSRAVMGWMLVFSTLILISILWALDRGVSLERAVKIAPQLITGGLLIGLMPRFATRLLICRVRRHASQTGEAYLSPRHFHE